MARAHRIPPPSDFGIQPSRSHQGDNWQDGLITAMSDTTQVYQSDELTVTLIDMFPKARYHYLVVPKEDINSVEELSRDKIALLEHIHQVAADFISRVHQKEPALKFRFGYHAVPSMRRLHLHIISQDFDSPRLYKQHHWNIFNTEYFIESQIVIDTLRDAGSIEIEKDKYESLLGLRMKCNRCGKKYNDIRGLKDHLVQEHGNSWNYSASAARRQSRC